jgi:hypothetical protein
VSLLIPFEDGASSASPAGGLSSTARQVAFHRLPERRQEAIPYPLIHEWTFPTGIPWTRFYRTPSGYRLRFPDLADFDVAEDGGSVSGWQAPGVSVDTLEHLYLNQVLPLALSRRGKLVFHASAIDVDGRAVAFLGESGTGKSTLAASFAANGLPFLCDDGLVIDMQEGQGVAVPSHPSIRLWQDSRQALLGDDACAAPALEFTTKLRYLAGNQVEFCAHARRLRCAFFLGNGTGIRVECVRLEPGSALIELVRHSFLLDIEKRDLLAAHFDSLSSLVRDVACFRFDFPRRFEALPDVRNEILRHVRSIRHV